MTEQRHGRYYAQELMMDQDANIREGANPGCPRLRQASRVAPRGGIRRGAGGQGVILCWDTARPGFGRTSR
jgi:hypothetical protein